MFMIRSKKNYNPCKVWGAWPGRRARWPTQSEAPPDLWPFLRFFDYPVCGVCRSGPGVASPRALERIGVPLERPDRRGNRDASVPSVDFQPARVLAAGRREGWRPLPAREHSRERACTQGPVGRLGGVLAPAALVALAAGCPLWLLWPRGCGGPVRAPRPLVFFPALLGQYNLA
ncbi:hypothetical protein NDU88_010925 [Pleurodeles waltl]|uniref:Uncharacterized protein n=1 Tax=Pleurodeles waltl TaxID=8319 RepID=A0AAV7S2S6_PLEWA|nr:hypothetical protein NDU88_010925 [Pleurodeles waltl]